MRIKLIFGVYFIYVSKIARIIGHIKRVSYNDFSYFCSQIAVSYNIVIENCVIKSIFAQKICVNRVQNLRYDLTYNRLKNLT